MKNAILLSQFRKIPRNGIGAHSVRREILTFFKRRKKMKATKMLTILVLALGLMVWPAPIVYGVQYLTVNGADVTSITLELGQSRTVEVVSTDGTSYVDYVGFDKGVVLGTFSWLETKPEAGNLATVLDYNQPAFYGYYVSAAGISPAPSAGVHFVFEYVAQELGGTYVKLYDSTFGYIDSIHITVIPLPPVAIGTAFTYQGRLLDVNSPADGLYDLQFKLYDNLDPVFAAQQGSTIDINDLDLIDGYFTVELDFGSDVFAGDARWLQIGVRPGASTGSFDTLMPRTELTPTPYAIYAQEAAYAQGAADLALPYSGTVSSGAAAFSVTNTGTGYAGNFAQTGSSTLTGGLNVTTAAGLYGAKILNQGGYPGYSYGLQVTTEKDTGSRAYGILSIANHNNNDAYGLMSQTTSTNNNAWGGFFTANAGGTYSRGIYIYADNTRATGGTSYGLQLYSDSANGKAYGVWSDVEVGSGSTSNLCGIYSNGKHLGTSGTSYGMYSYVYGSDGGDTYGIYSDARKYSSDTAGTAYGGYFIGDNDRAAGDSYGLYTQATGLNGNRYGLYSKVTTTSGSYDNYGLYTEVANNGGYSYGLYADLDPEETGYGVYVDLATTAACTDYQRGLSSVVRHNGTKGDVYGVASYTHSSDTGATLAGYFSAHSSPGDTGALYGIRAYCDNDTSGGKYAGYFVKSGGGNYAGYFSGNVHITGTLTKSSGSFKIDHPLDPENKYLSHSFVESPDMMNVYNGNAALDENGEACVQLPEYFEALNQDFRYQLTAIGAPAPNLYIAEKISDNRFKIAGGKPGMEVSWQVTGVRHDPYAVAHRVQAEEEKNNDERGYYLNPMAYGLPEEKGIESVRNTRVSETRQVAKNDSR